MSRREETGTSTGPAPQTVDDPGQGAAGAVHLAAQCHLSTGRGPEGRARAVEAVEEDGPEPPVGARDIGVQVGEGSLEGPPGHGAPDDGSGVWGGVEGVGVVLLVSVVGHTTPEGPVDPGGGPTLATGSPRRSLAR